MIDDSLPLDRKERRLVMREAYKLSWRNPVTALLFALCFIVAMYGIVLFVEYVPRTGWIGAIAPGLVGAVLGLTIASTISYFRIRPCVHVILRQRGYDICLKCGYWLRGLDKSVLQCPECGRIRQRMSEGAE